MTHTKRLAHIAGWLYLAVGIFGGFAQGYFQPLLYAPGDAATTAANVASHIDLMPWGVVADLTQATCFVFLALILHCILKPTGAGRSRAMLVLVGVQTKRMQVGNPL